MASVTQTGIDSWEVVGSMTTLTILVSLDEVNGALYHIYQDGEPVCVRADLDAAIEHADTLADGGYFGEDEPDEDDERDPFNSDAEADADVLASAGWGTDEDYGYFGGDDC